MPHFNIACDDCKILYRAYKYGFRGPRQAPCPVCKKMQKSRQWKTVLRLEGEGYRWVRLVWDREQKAWVLKYEEPCSPNDGQAVGLVESNAQDNETQDDEMDYLDLEELAALLRVAGENGLRKIRSKHE